MTRRETSLRYFVIIALAFTAWRLVTTIAWLLFGPGLEPGHTLTQIAYYLSKAVLGGLFWPISFFIEALHSPLSWLCPPW